MRDGVEDIWLLSLLSEKFEQFDQTDEQRITRGQDPFSRKVYLKDG